MITTITVTRDELAAAFVEWKRRDDAESFPDHEGTPEEYGDDSADYLIELLNEAKDLEHVDGSDGA